MDEKSLRIDRLEFDVYCWQKKYRQLLDDYKESVKNRNEEISRLQNIISNQRVKNICASLKKPGNDLKYFIGKKRRRDAEEIDQLFKKIKL